MASSAPAHGDPASARKLCNAATALHAVAGFLSRHRVETSHLVEAGGKLPVIILFVDTDEHASRVLPIVKERAAHQLIVRENIVLQQGNLD